MDDLIAFMRAQLDEDEQAAQACLSKINQGRGEWAFRDMQVRDDRDHLIVQHTWPNEGEHIARHDPARVLREVEAKRLQLDLHKGCGATCYVVRVVALPYADRPGYKEKWRP